MRKQLEALINSDFNANQVAVATGLPRNTVYRIFSGEAKLDNVTLKNAEILLKFWEENKMKDYGVVLETVREALNDGETYELAEKFAGSADGETVEQVVAEQFHQAVNGVDDFNMTVKEYLKLSLDLREEANEA